MLKPCALTPHPAPPFVRTLLLIALTLSAGCSLLPKAPLAPAPEPAAISAAFKGRSADTSQLVVVSGAGEGSIRGTLFTFEREGDGWKRVLGPLPAMVGRSGFAAAGEKREGDGKTPSGLFPLEFVFGYADQVATRMPYRQATENDIWVDDVNSPDYNKWVKKGESSAASFEFMKLPDRRYRHGVVIGYNRNPIVKGKGSAIFMHAWLKVGGGTAGCVSLDEPQLVEIIAWLDPARKPMILMGNEGDLLSLAREGGEGGTP